MRHLLVVVGLLLPALALGQTTRVLPSDSYKTACVLDAANESCVLDLAGKLGAGMVITAVSSPSGITLTPQVSLAHDCADATYIATRFENPTLSSGTLTLVNADLAANVSRGIVIPQGTRCVRVKDTAWTSGSVTLTVTGTDALSSTRFLQNEVKGDGAYTAHTAGAFDGPHIDTQGRLVVRAEHWNPFVCRTNGQTTMVNATCTPAAPGGASTYHYVTGVVLSNGPTAQTMKVIASTTTACGGSPTDVTSTVYLGINSGAAMTFPNPVKIGQANSYLCCQGSGNTAASCTITGFLAP